MRNVDRETDPEQALRSLKDLGSKMTECKRCVARLALRLGHARPCCGVSGSHPRLSCPGAQPDSGV